MYDIKDNDIKDEEIREEARNRLAHIAELKDDM